MRAQRAAVLLCCMTLAVAARSAWPGPARESKTVSSAYPGLEAGALRSATLGDLPAGVVLRGESLEITEAALQGKIAKLPADLRAQLGDNAVFLLGEFAAQELVLRAARAAATHAGASLEGKSDQQITTQYLESKVASITVTDDEIATFYNENRAMLGDAELAEVKPSLSALLLKQKRQKAVQAYVRSLGAGLVVSASWVKAQAARAKLNPVAEARASGKPSVVDFGATGCHACDLMAPILESLKTEYAGKANVVFVHVRREPGLAQSYGITSIPTQVFFDKDGKETYRHTGYLSQRSIERQLRKMGVR